jgi:hypothetical protein
MMQRQEKKTFFGDFFGNSPLSHIIILVWCDFYAFGFLKRRFTCVGSFNQFKIRKIEGFS